MESCQLNRLTKREFVSIVDAANLNIPEPELTQVWYSLNAVLAAAEDIDSLELDTPQFPLLSENARNTTDADSGG